MKTKIDVKSVIIVALLTVVVMFGVVTATEEVDQIGRYQIIEVVEKTHSFVVLLDSTTGETWKESVSRVEYKF